MKVKWRIAVKAVVYFLLLGFVLPVLLERRVDAVWVIICAGIAFVITVVPEYLTMRFKRKRAGAPAIAVKGKWIRIAAGTVVMFPLMAFAWPSLAGERADTAWVIISAITAPIAAVIADYLTEKQKERKRRNTQESQRTQSRKN
jgi:NhaP-type Na+/H+ or K+/H+ antiporter